MGTTQILNVIKKEFALFLFLLIGSNYYSQNGEQFPINDPRNPNCPCHKLQKQAEDEYKNLMANATKGNAGNNFMLQQNANRNPVQQRINRNNISNKNILEQGISEADQFQQNSIQSIQNNEINMQPLPQIFLPVGEQEQGISFSGLNFRSKGVSSSGSFHKGKRTAHTKHIRKKFIYKHKKLQKLLDVQHWNILKEFKNVTACYHWN